MSTRPNTKGWKILEALAEAHPAGVSRQSVADSVGCTVQRVGEVINENREIVTNGKELGYAILPSKVKALAKAHEKAIAAAAKAKEAAAAHEKAATAAKAKAAHADKPRGAAKRNATAKKLATALAGLGDD